MSDHEEKHGGEEHGGGSHGGGHGGGGHGGGHGEHEETGAPEWLISFADNVALMMGFFVILLAMNMGPKGTPVQGGEPDETNNGVGTGATSRAEDIIISIREGFNSSFDAKSSDANERRMAALKKQRDELRKSDSPAGTAPKAQVVRDTPITNLGGVVFFDNQSADLSSTAQDTLRQVAEKLKDQRWIVELRGAVSPFETGRNAEKAMSLSYERALSAARSLTRYGVPWPQLRLVACGDGNRAIGRSNAHDDDKPNQRVEIVVTKETVAPDAFSKDAGAN